MNIAELFVRVRGDTTDVTRSLKGVETSMAGVERSSIRLGGGVNRAHLSTGKLRQELVTLVRQATGTAPVIAQLGTVIGEAIAGSTLVLGVTAGIAAIAGAYKLLTAESRKAREESDKMTASLVAQARAAREATVAGAADLELIQQVNLENVRRESRFGLRTILKGAITGNFGVSDADAEAHAKRLADAQTAVEQASANVAKAQEAAAQATGKSTTRTGELTFKYNQLRDAAERVNAEILKENKDWWKNYIEKTSQALSLTEQLQQRINATRPSVLDILHDLTTINVPTVDISDSARIAGAQAKEINDVAKDNTQTIANAVLSGAGIIVNALNIGGGGRGSGIGGALGSVVGTAAGSIAASHIGSTFGSLIAPGIGTIVGGLAGSLVGGLFDHRKAVDRNTIALNNLAAQLSNAPGGFKVAGYNYSASDAKRLYRQQVETARRESTRGGRSGFALQAGM